MLNAQGCVLLFHFDFATGALAGNPFWATPGGGVHPGETFAEAAQRELFEETGLTEPVGSEIARREAHFLSPEGESIRGLERYFGIRVDNPALDFSHQTEWERAEMQVHRWWTVDALRNTTETVYPEEIIEFIGMVRYSSESVKLRGTVF